MATRHLLKRISPEFDRRWLIGVLVVGLLILAATFIRRTGVAPPLELVALGPDGNFSGAVAVPASWGDTTTTAPDAVSRVPLVLAVRNPGLDPLTPEQLELSLPLRYRLTTRGGEELPSRTEPASPLVTYTLEPRLGAVQPRRLPAILPAHDTIWLEVTIPSYYCVAVADSIPDFVVAPEPPLASFSDVRIFYSFSGQELKDRHTGLLAVRLDTTLLQKELPPQPPSFPMVSSVEEAQPELGPLADGGSRTARCGEPGAPMELLSTIWETPEGGRFIALDYGGKVRKHLFDLDGDGVIERESWDPDGDGEFDATRRASLPIPDFLLPLSRATGYDMARLDSLPPDSLERLDPFRRAMSGPGTLPPPGDTTPYGEEEPVAEAPQPAQREPQPLGRPLGEPVPDRR